MKKTRQPRGLPLRTSPLPRRQIGREGSSSAITAGGGKVVVAVSAAAASTAPRHRIDDNDDPPVSESATPANAFVPNAAAISITRAEGDCGQENSTPPSRRRPLCSLRRALNCCVAVNVAVSPSTPDYCSISRYFPPSPSSLTATVMSHIPTASQSLLLMATAQNSSIPSRLRKLSQAFFNSQPNDKIDLMNDWEIGGTQNKWVCPSDRHLQLRAQLKSGWSVRTATARSPTNAKQMNGGITEAEQEQIRAVLARAEAGRACEQQRIGRMVDRLEKMRSRATGNGVTQCLLCSTDFGLLAAKSYAAMCSDCRKYVCQKNCGVETYDCTRRETVFLCKVCSEYREVMWKKSGAWFYKELPEYVKPAENGEVRSPPYYAKTWQHHGKSTVSNGSAINKHRSTNNTPNSVNATEQNRTKSPRPRITPSWVREKVQSSMSIGTDDENASSSEAERFSSSKEEIQKTPTQSIRRPRSQKHSSSGKSSSIQRFGASARSRITDTEESGESRHSTPSTSPRHSPSSFGDDLSLNPSSIIASDAKSIDSGVVPSDYSAPVNAQMALSSSLIGLRAKAAPSPPEKEASLKGSAVTSPQHGATATSSPLAGIQASSLMSSSPSSSSQMAAQSQTQYQRPSQSAAFEATSQPQRTTSASSSIHQMTAVPSSSSSPPTAGSPAPPIPPRGARQYSPLPDRRASAESSTCSGCQPTTQSNESLLQAVDNDLKQDEATTSFMSSPEEEAKSTTLGNASARRFRSPFTWRHKPKPLVSRVMSDHMSGTRSTMSLGSAAYVADEPLVRRTVSGSEFPSKHDDPSLTAVDHMGTFGSIQFSLLYLPDQKQLRVKLFRAKNLRAMDKNGFSDPYVKLHLIPGAAKATKLTSKTIEKTLNPEWNEEFTYHGVNEDDRTKKTLRVTVLDRDRIGSDFLGETRVPLKKLAPGVEKNFNLYLENAMPVVKDTSGGGERGKILVGVVYNVQQGSLFVSIKRCVELVGMDPSGFSDPYVKVALTPLACKAHRQKTSTKKKTLNPEFNETLAFVVPFKDLPMKTLQIGVYDHDVGKHDDYIGGVLLSASAKGERQKQWIYCMQNPGSMSEYWHKLELDT